MPELPDLHVYAMNLKKRVLNNPIVEASVHNGKRMNVPPNAFVEAVRGAQIIDIDRVGKELHFRLSNKATFGVHLMLNGRFHLCDATAAPAIPNKIFSLAFQDGDALSVSDFSGLCRVTLNPRKGGAPDVLSDRFDRAYFDGAVRSNFGMNVKAFLIDQNIMKGIGNAYADEILWKANLSPESVIGKIPGDALSDLYLAIGDVLRDAIDSILRISPDIISGEERSFLRVHNPKKSCTAEGDAILVKEIATKRTYYTMKQRMYR